MLSKIIKKSTIHIGLDVGYRSTRLAITQFGPVPQVMACHLLAAVPGSALFISTLKQILTKLNSPIRCAVGAIRLSQVKWQALALPEKASLRWTHAQIHSLLFNHADFDLSQNYHDWCLLSQNQLLALTAKQSIVEQCFSGLQVIECQRYAVDVHTAALLRLVETTSDDYLLIDASQTGLEIVWVKQNLPMACQWAECDSTALDETAMQTIFQNVCNSLLQQNSAFHLYQVYGTGECWPIWLGFLEKNYHHHAVPIVTIEPSKKYLNNSLVDSHLFNLAIGLSLWDGVAYENGI